MSTESADGASREVAAVELLTSDLVGLALRSVEDLEVSLPQFRLLRVLHQLGDLGATRCAQELGVAGSSVTRLVDRLDSSGHLVRRPDATNRSAVVLALTRAGRALVEQVERRRRDELRRALERLDDGERQACVAALERLHQLLGHADDPRIPY